MDAIVFDGKSLARKLEAELSLRVQALKEGSNGLSPILATILVGDDPASAKYVRMKCSACPLIAISSSSVSSNAGAMKCDEADLR